MNYLFMPYTNKGDYDKNSKHSKWFEKIRFINDDYLNEQLNGEELRQVPIVQFNGRFEEYEKSVRAILYSHNVKKGDTIFCDFDYDLKDVKDLLNALLSLQHDFGYRLCVRYFKFHGYKNWDKKWREYEVA